MSQLNTHTKRGRWAGLAVVASLALMLTAMAASASARDRNHDGIPDRWEKRHKLSLKVDQAPRDQDSDEMPNIGEFEAGTDPRDADSDGDGTPDGEELAGEVASFTPGEEEDTGTLVITLYAGGELSGTVDEDTRIICPREEEAAEEESSDEQSAEASSRQGPGPSGRPPLGPPPSDDDESADDESADEDEAAEGEGPSGRPSLGQGPPGNQGPGGHHDGCHGTPCSTDELVAGATVHEADVNVSANGNKFKVVALG